MSDWKVTLSALSDRYDIITEIGKGTYGEVYKCLDKQTGQVVALKKINILDDKEGFPQTTIREIDLLSRLHHENIVSLRAIVTTFPQDYGLSGNSHVYLVFEYCEFDLYGLLYAYTEPILTPLHIVSYIKQLLVAVKVCHDNAIVHRDLKPANLFVTRKNVVKLGDFGLARRIVRDREARYTSNVITLYYRAPELLLGCKSYKWEIDIWSVGCIIYEMMTKELLFRSPAKTTSLSHQARAQCEAIFEICGVPSASDWPEFERLEGAKVFLAPKRDMTNRLFTHLQQRVPKEFSGAVDLLMRMLQLNPAKRITAEEAMLHPFIAQYGTSIEPSSLPPIEYEQELHQMGVSAEKKKREAKMKQEQEKAMNQERPNENEEKKEEVAKESEEKKEEVAKENEEKEEIAKEDVKE